LNVFRTALTVALVLAGLAQIGIALTSLFIPRLLNWRQETACLSPLTRKVFWTYAGYTAAINLLFGILCAAGVNLLVDGSALAGVVTAFIGCYWLVRVVLQFTFYERSIAETRVLFRVAEVLYVSAFAFVALTGLTAALFNFGVL
jgi:hypothetical protein